MNFEKKLSEIFEDVNTGYQSVSESDANKFLNNEASQYKQPQLVYTEKPSDSPDGDYLIVEPLQRNLDYRGRYHSLIIDSFETWEEFPQRGNGIVGTTDTDDEGNYYVVIPENGATMGISSKKHIMDSFPNVAVNLGIKFENFNSTLNLILNIFNNPEGTFEQKTMKLTKPNLVRYDSDYDTFKDAVEKVDDNFSSNEYHAILSDIVSHPYNKQTEDNVISLIEYIKSQGQKLSFILDQIFDPYENDKCLLVKESVFSKLNFSISDDSENESENESEVGSEK